VVEEILGEVSRMPPELVSWKPAADVWSVLENLCHIDEFVPPWTGEALNVVRDPTRTWGRDHTDTRRLAAVEAASTRTLSSSVRYGLAWRQPRQPCPGSVTPTCRLKR
jgi:hypothetical protein